MALIMKKALLIQQNLFLSRSEEICDLVGYLLGFLGRSPMSNTDRKLLWMSV